MARNRNRMTPDRWLYNLHLNLRVWFRDNGYKLPPHLEFHCGWPSSKRTLGSTHMEGEQEVARPLVKQTTLPAPNTARPTAYQIFIIPTIDQPMAVAEVVVHELIHAALPKSVWHTAPFQDACRKLGLICLVNKGKNNCVTDIDDQRKPWFNHPRRGAHTEPDNDPPRLSAMGVELREILIDIIARLGPYPHKALPERRKRTGGGGGGKAIRFKCPECAWVVRIGPVSLAMGPPLCGNYDCENYGQECEERIPKPGAAIRRSRGASAVRARRSAGVVRITTGLVPCMRPA